MPLHLLALGLDYRIGADWPATAQAVAYSSGLADVAEWLEGQSAVHNAVRSAASSSGEKRQLSTAWMLLRRCFGCIIAGMTTEMPVAVRMLLSTTSGSRRSSATGSFIRSDSGRAEDMGIRAMRSLHRLTPSGPPNGWFATKNIERAVFAVSPVNSMLRTLRAQHRKGR